MSQTNEILDFWFGKLDDVDYGKPRKVWFIKNPEFDQQVRSRFLKDYQQAAVGELDNWKTSPQGFDKQLLPIQRQFIYLPFEHSENLEHQRQCIQLFSMLKDHPECSSCVDYAHRHHKVIERFGRFPHRNKILGRETTPEEAEFLKQPGSSF